MFNGRFILSAHRTARIENAWHCGTFPKKAEFPFIRMINAVRAQFMCKTIIVLCMLTRRLTNSKLVLSYFIPLVEYWPHAYCTVHTSSAKKYDVFSIHRCRFLVILSSSPFRARFCIRHKCNCVEQLFSHPFNQHYNISCRCCKSQ